jgi:mannose-6-phosphate isomerase-like protein (cupin superfamily)
VLGHSRHFDAPHDAPPVRLRATVADYAIRRLEEIPDVLGDYPGEMRMSAASDLGTEQVSFTWRRMPPQTGGKGSYGHRHKTQEEIYFVASGQLLFKLEDEVLEVPAGSVVRIAPRVVRSVWNDGPEDAVLIMCSIKSDDPTGDHETVPDFWPE